MNIKVIYSNETNNLDYLYKLLVSIIIKEQSISNDSISEGSEQNEENSSTMQSK